jgi:hypothetical protein
VSDQNGTALATSQNAPAEVKRPGVTGPGDFVASMEDTAPMDVVDLEAPRGFRTNATLAEQVRLANERLKLQNDPALREALPDVRLGSVLEADQAAQQQIRDAERAASTELALARITAKKEARLKDVEGEKKAALARGRQSTKSSLAATKRDARAQRFEDKAAGVALSLELWKRRATARWERQTDPASRMALVYKMQYIVMAALGLLALGGIAWTAHGVKEALVGPYGNPLAYIVEPLASVPFLVLMVLHAIAAMFGRKFPQDRKQKALVLTVEVVLGLAIIITNVSPVVPVLGTWQTFPVFLGKLLPPMLIVVAVVLMSLAASFFSNLLVELFPAEVNGGRLDDDTAKVLDGVKRIWAAMNAGELKPSIDNTPGEVAPSASKIAAYLNINKGDAGAVRDGVNRIFGTAS